eukprot:RCo026548
MPRSPTSFPPKVGKPDFRLPARSTSCPAVLNYTENLTPARGCQGPFGGLTRTPSPKFARDLAMRTGSAGPTLPPGEEFWRLPGGMPVAPPASPPQARGSGPRVEHVPRFSEHVKEEIRKLVDSRLKFGEITVDELLIHVLRSTGHTVVYPVSLEQWKGGRGTPASASRGVSRGVRHAAAAGACRANAGPFLPRQFRRGVLRGESRGQRRR